MNTFLVNRADLTLARMHPLPCLQSLPRTRSGGRARVGCERSERDVTLALNFPLKHKQPHPNPPLPSQGREQLEVNSKRIRINP